MKNLFRKNKELLKKRLKEQGKVDKPDLSKEVQKMEELKSLLKK